MPEDDKEEVLAVASPPNVLNPELRPEPGKATPKATTKAALKAVPTTEPDGIEAAVDQLSRDTAPVMAGWLRQIEA
ncbi:MAG: hypothetical protein LBI62_06245, partial [Candidatus Accumulibacter sp.]|nr:hypothetical protein [Accumulibacter sp.]